MSKDPQEHIVLAGPTRQLVPVSYDLEGALGRLDRFLAGFADISPGEVLLVGVVGVVMILDYHMKTFSREPLASADGLHFPRSPKARG